MRDVPPQGIIPQASLEALTGLKQLSLVCTVAAWNVDGPVLKDQLSVLTALHSLQVRHVAGFCQCKRPRVLRQRNKSPSWTWHPLPMMRSQMSCRCQAAWPG